MHVVDSVSWDGEALRILGWCLRREAEVSRVWFEGGGVAVELTDGYGLESEDVAAFFGKRHRRVRFEFLIAGAIKAGTLIFEFDDGVLVRHQVDALEVESRVTPLRHQFSEGVYRGRFGVRGTASIGEVVLLFQKESLVLRKDLCRVFSSRVSGTGLQLDVEVELAPELAAGGIGIELVDDLGERLIVSDVKMLAMGQDPANRISGRFLEGIRAVNDRLSVLEIGSRSRSGVVRRSQFGVRHEYIGIDIRDGENVDLVCDAHELGSVFPGNRFDRVAGFSVFEHLAMPWKVAIELNKVLKTGGRAMFYTHQSWPVHDSPYDFWRYSEDSWRAIFNRATGFRILETACGGPTVFRPEIDMLEGIGIGDSHGFLSSAVLVEKVGSTNLSWDVPMSEVHRGDYPS